MATPDSPPAAPAGGVEESKPRVPLLDQPEWKKLVAWMRIYGNLDTDRLATHIRDQWELRERNADITQTQTKRYVGDAILFQLMVLRIAVFDAALTDPRKRRDLQSLAAQTEQYFSSAWINLDQGLNEPVLQILKSTAEKLRRDAAYCRRPDKVINTFRPLLIGTSSFDEEIGGWPEVSLEGMESVGPALYKTTLRNSSRALMGAISLRKSLAPLVEKENETKKMMMKQKMLNAAAAALVAVVSAGGAASTCAAEDLLLPASEEASRREAAFLSPKIQDQTSTSPGMGDNA